MYRHFSPLDRHFYADFSHDDQRTGGLSIAARLHQARTVDLQEVAPIWTDGRGEGAAMMGSTPA
jgi:hypothetical protein